MFVCIPPGKAIPKMTYTVSGGTLNAPHSLTHYRHYSCGSSGAWRPMVNDLDFVLVCFKHAPRLLHVSVCISRSLVNDRVRNSVRNKVIVRVSLAFNKYKTGFLWLLQNGRPLEWWPRITPTATTFNWGWLGREIASHLMVMVS